MEKKTQGAVLSQQSGNKRRFGRLGLLALAAVVLASASGLAQTPTMTPIPGQTTDENPFPRKSHFGVRNPVTYDNKYEFYGGLNFMTFQAGQALPKRMNLGGGEALGTWWATPRLGVGAEYRGEWGTTPVRPNPYFNGRALVSLQMMMGGVQWRGPKNQYAAINYHAYAGPAYGIFDHTTNSANVPAVFLPQVGLYTNRWAFVSALGGSVDVNKSKNWAIRLSPDLMIERFGTETRYFFAISGGVVYRIGKR